MPHYLTTAQGRQIAYEKTEGTGPMVVFLGGLKSDMEGSKATHFETWCKAAGRAYLRFDYSGHGQSSGRFEEGAIGDWHEDVMAVIEHLTEGPLIIVGSSMGGWQSLLLARKLPNRIKGMVLIAAAPDFTETHYWADFTEAQKTQIMTEGQIEIPSDYMDPYVITKRMIMDGRAHLVLNDPLALPFPVRMVLGSNDTAVRDDTTMRLLRHADCADLRLTVVRGKDHSFSDPECLDLLCDLIAEVS